MIAGVGSCTVWWAAPLPPGKGLGLIDLLDTHERERLWRLRRDLDRARYLAAHALARLVLSAALDRPPAALTFDRTCRCGRPHGKPRLCGGGPAFSLTHGGDIVGVAVHEAPVGVDVEQTRSLTDLPGLAAHVCSPAEIAPDALSFFRLWTRKEAVLKATGDGLSIPMSDLTLGRNAVAHWAGAPGPVWLRDLTPVAGHPAAVAGLGAAAPVVVEADGDTILRR